jgi:uncharacterized protein (DUF1800 family)
MTLVPAFAANNGQHHEAAAGAKVALQSSMPGTAQTAAPKAQAARTIFANNEKALRLLNRITFGPRPGDLETVKAVGLETYIEQQLNPESIREAPDVQDFIHNADALRMSPSDLYRDYGPPSQAAAQAKAKQEAMIVNDRRHRIQARSGEAKIFEEVAQGKIMRAVESPRQLEELMTDFWFNHFNIYANKGLDHIWLGAYEQEAIRPFALGKFRDLVEHTCYHPAMLFYLDNWQNSAPGTKVGKTTTGLNENYARELMELHTLGVDGGYTQKDVTELARILTGLGIAKMDKNGLSGGQGYGYFFDSSRHDFGTKTLLGHTIRGSGEGEIKEALDILLKHPSTAHHISYQLAQYFVCDEPPKSLVDRLASKFTETDGDMKQVMRTLLQSPEFWNPLYENSKFKNPFRYVVSTLRASGARPGSYYFVIQFLRNQGMPMYGCLTPDGYKNTKEAWVNPDTLLKRIGFATTVAAGGIPEVSPGLIEYRRLGATLGSTFSAQTVRVIMKSPEILRPALILASPEFMQY